MNKAIVKDKNLEFFDIANTFLMIALLVILIAPFWFALVGSLNEGLDYARGGVYLFPRKITLANYISAFIDRTIVNAYVITVLRTVIGTFINVFFTMMVANAMSRNNLKLRNIYMTVFLITMFFYGGIIPTYLLYKEIGLINHFLVYIIPNIFNVWYMIIFISFIKTIPEALLESARIDGANEYTIFLKLIIPLSKPVIAAIALFVGVWHWSSYFDSMMYTTSNSLQTIQLFLMRIITSANAAAGLGSRAANAIPHQAIKVSPETIKLAMMIITTGPIILLYPFLQKYFIKGILIGSVKG